MTTALLARSLRVLSIAAVCSASSVPGLWADPIAVTSGRFVLPADEPVAFQFFGADGFVLSSIFTVPDSSPNRRCVSGCAPGTAVNMSTVVGGSASSPAFALGSSTGAIVNGIVFLEPFGLRAESPRLAGTFRFDAPAIVPPPFAFDKTEKFPTVPFVFNGTVTGFAADDRDARMPLFHVDLVGQGTAFLSFEDVDLATGTWRETVTTYTFAATPEPTSVVLLGTGLIGLMSRRRTKRRREHSI